MSTDTPAIQQRFMTAVGTGDMEGLRALLHPDFSMTQAPTLPYGGTYRGPDGFIGFLGTFMEKLEIEALDGKQNFIGDDRAIVGEVYIRAKLRETGKTLETTLLEKWEFADGKVIAISPHYFDTTFR
jgi:ketosteroid isomerase-like protein